MTSKQFRKVTSVWRTACRNERSPGGRQGFFSKGPRGEG
jgi:hypothetical protein